MSTTYQTLKTAFEKHRYEAWKIFQDAQSLPEMQFQKSLRESNKDLDDEAISKALREFVETKKGEEIILTPEERANYNFHESQAEVLKARIMSEFPEVIAQDSEARYLFGDWDLVAGEDIKRTLIDEIRAFEEKDHED